MQRERFTDLKRRKVETRRYFDFSLLFSILLTCVIGLVVIYSSSAYIAQRKNLPSNYFLVKQIKSLAVGLGVLALTTLIPYRFYFKKLSFIKLPFLRRGKESPYFRISMEHPPIVVLITIAAFALQFWASFLIKEDRNGAKRWINIPFFGTLQASEVSKLAVILLASYICAKYLKHIKGIVKLAWFTLPCLIITALIAKENLSSAIIVFGIYMAIFIVAGRGFLSYVVYVLILGAIAFLREAFKGGYRWKRILDWRNSENVDESGQIMQGLYAIASGGIFGKGLGESAGKFGKISEAYNDMIFTIICEELGIFGAFVILAIYVFMIKRMINIAFNAPDLIGSLITVGVVCQIALQVLLNVAVVTKAMPSTGITLPFISFGGSSLVFLFAGVGIVLNISLHIKYQVHD